MLSDKVLTRTDGGDTQIMGSAFRRIYLAFSDLKPFITDRSLLNIEISIRSMADALGEICYNGSTCRSDFERQIYADERRSGVHLNRIKSG